VQGTRENRHASGAAPERAGEVARDEHAGSRDRARLAPLAIGGGLWPDPVMRAPTWLSAIVLLSGCDAPPVALDGGADAGPPDAPSCTVQIEDPDDDDLSTWPDSALLVDDPSTETGQRLVLDLDRYTELAARLSGYRATLTEDLSEVDGFGINAEAFFQFGRAFDADALPGPDEAAPEAQGLGFVVLGPGEPSLVSALPSLTDEGGTLLLSPLRPLPPRARVAAYVTRALTEAAGGCLEPSASTAAALAAPDAAWSEAIDALTALGAIDGASELVALTVYPTQSIYEDGLAIAEDVAGRTFDFVAPPTCTDEAAWTLCEAEFVAMDYRDPEDGVIRRARGEAADPQAMYTIPVTAWLPRDRTGPVPTLVYGHGLTGDRFQAGRLAAFAAPLGIATVAIDALEHGDHPTVGGTRRESLQTLFAFFGINTGMLSSRALEAARLRDNFAQSAFDRLQLTRLLAAHPDLDGDGADDLDLAQLAYLGVSLGGIMGPQQLALDGSIGAGVLVVPGGRVSTIISDSATFAPLITAVRPRGTTEGDVRRFFPILQTILDRGDPASWAPTILGERLPGVSGLPDVLVGMVLDDEIVPNVANYAIGRALGVPMVEVVLRPQPGFDLVTGPVRSNFTRGADTATGGLLQFDVVGDGMGGLEMADHGNVGDSDVGAEAWLHFLTTHLAGEAEIEDPYAALGIVR
jgi:hypothetical protein